MPWRDLRREIGRPGGRLTAACVAIALSGFVVVPQTVRGDDTVRAVMLRQMADGIKPDSKYSFIQPALSTPLYWLLDTLHFGIYAMTLQPLAWIALWCWAVWRCLARHRSPAFAHHAIVLTLASLVGAYLVGFGSDVFTALGMSGGLIVGLLGGSPAARALAWCVFVVAAANTPVMLAASAAVALWLVVTRRQVRYMLLPAGVLALVVAESTIVTGELSWTRYTREVEHGELPLLPWGDVSGFGWPLWSGVLAVLFSFGRGLVFYIPTVWNGPTRSTDAVGRAERALWVAGVVLIPIYATWWAWFGGLSFGPRFFMLLAAPGALAGAAVVCDESRSLARSAVAAVAVTLSAWVAVGGAVFGVTSAAFDRCVAGGTFQNFALCLYTPEYSGLWNPIWAADPIGLRDLYLVAVMAAAVMPTMWAIAAPCRAPLADGFGRLRRHLGGEWRL